MPFKLVIVLQKKRDPLADIAHLPGNGRSKHCNAFFNALILYPTKMQSISVSNALLCVFDVWEGCNRVT